jgi:DNA-directed RNA polymerase subunit omega
MSVRFDTMMEPRIEELLGRTGSKFTLVALASARARQINSYYGQLGEGIGAIVPPQVSSTASKSLSIAFQEIAADKILGISQEEADAAAADAAAAAAPDDDAADGDADGSD